MAQSILCVMAHPDDETLACGGTLARFAREGATVRVLTFTDGVSSRGANAEAAATRRREYLAACAVLGAEPYETMTYPDQRLDVEPQLVLVQQVEAALCVVQPDTVITHWPHDLNPDHRAVAQAVLGATRLVAGSGVRRVLAAEVPESTSQAFGAPAFAPNVFVELQNEDRRAKQDALAQYVSELRAWPHPRSIGAVKQRVNLWGGVAGVYDTEAFVLLREVIPCA